MLFSRELICFLFDRHIEIAENWDTQLKQQVESLENVEPGFIFRLITGPCDGFYYNPIPFTPDNAFTIYKLYLFSFLKNRIKPSFYTFIVKCVRYILTFGKLQVKLN